MERLESLLTGPLLYLLIAWGIVTVAFIALIIWRSLLSSHEDDQLFLDSGQAPMEREQRELISRIDSLSRPLMTSGIASVVLLVIVGLVVYQGLRNFSVRILASGGRLVRRSLRLDRGRRLRLGLRRKR